MGAVAADRSQEPGGAALAAAPQQSGGKRSTGTRRVGGSGQCRRWPTIVHYATAAHGVPKVLACTDPTGGQTDPAMEAPDPSDPPVWASASKEDRADKPTSTFVPGTDEGRGGGARERESEP